MYYKKRIERILPGPWDSGCVWKDEPIGFVDRLAVGIGKIKGLKKDFKVWASMMGKVRRYHHLRLGKIANRVGYSSKVRSLVETSRLQIEKTDKQLERGSDCQRSLG